MEEEKKKPRLQINMGGLIIIIIIALILFKVDIKSKIKSEQFQKNITYVEDTIKGFYKDISEKIKDKTGTALVNFTGNQLEKMQTNFSENILKDSYTNNKKILED